MIVFLFIFLICAVAIAFLFFKKFKGSRKMKIVILAILLLLLIMLAFMKITKGFVPLPMGLRHLMYLAMPPEDLYEPIVKDNFLFYEEGFTKTYSLQSKYLASYDIGFSIESGNLSSEYKFSGKVKADFYWKDKLLFSKEITSQISASYANNDLEHFADVRLLCFEIPFQGKYVDDISVRLTVLESDETLKQYGDLIKLFIVVGSLE